MAGVLTDEAGRVLIAQRPPGKSMAGQWEFPGGKLKAGEDPRTGLERELREELGVSARDMSPLIRFRHRYPDTTVLLDVWRVQYYDGVATGLEGQSLRWLTPAQLPEAAILAADRPILDALRLPERYVITPGVLPQPPRLAGLIKDLTAKDSCLVLLRAPALSPAAYRDAALALAEANAVARVVLHGDPEQVLPLALEAGAAGIHAPARFLSGRRGVSAPRHLLVGASCHDRDELDRATAFDANFAVLGPVQATASHPDAPPLGWKRFSQLVDAACLPVYALGGIGPGDLGRARAAGAQGVAGISAFWPAA